MRQAFSLVIAAAMLVGLSSAALAEEMVDNPAYKSWASYKPGTSVTRTIATEITKVEGVDNIPPGMVGRKMPEQTMSQKLLEVTADKVVVETTMSGMAGRTVTAPRKVEIAAKIEKSKVDSALASEDAKATVKNVKDGTDTLEIKGQKLDVKTKEMDVDTDSNGQKITAHVKVWLSETVPGAAAKMVMEAKTERGPMTMTMGITTMVVDYSIAK
jgi:hypothetical protein